MILLNAAETLDVLESWVRELFSKVKKEPVPKQEAMLGSPVWKAGKLYRLEAVKDVHMLDLSWTLPCLRKNYMKKSEDYLAHLIGHGNIMLSSLLFYILSESAYYGNMVCDV